MGDRQAENYRLAMKETAVVKIGVVVHEAKCSQTTDFFQRSQHCRKFKNFKKRKAFLNVPFNPHDDVPSNDGSVKFRAGIVRSFLCILMQSLANLHGSINKMLWRCCGWKFGVGYVNELLKIFRKIFVNIFKYFLIHIKEKLPSEKNWNLFRIWT